jgi:hypothetical protein
LKSIDDISYALLGTVLAATCFLLGNVIFYKAVWQLVAAPFVGGVLGLVAAASVLRDMKLPLAATMGDVKACQKRKDT